MPDRHSSRGEALAVLDTQVVLDWLVFRDPGVVSLSEAIEIGSVRWLTTLPMRDELAHVLSRGVGAAWQPDPAQVLLAFDRMAWVTGTPTALPAGLRCSDPDDQMFIDLALASGARWLFTRDRTLLRLASRARARGVAVIRPADWPGTPSTAS